MYLRGGMQSQGLWLSLFFCLLFLDFLYIRAPQILHPINVNELAGRGKNPGQPQGIEPKASCFSCRCSDHWAMTTHSHPGNISLQEPKVASLFLSSAIKAVSQSSSSRCHSLSLSNYLRTSSSCLSPSSSSFILMVSMSAFHLLKWCG